MIYVPSNRVTWGPFYENRLTDIIMWINNYIHIFIWVVIIQPYPNFNR